MPNPPNVSVSDLIEQAYAGKRWETARRLALQALDQPGLSQAQTNRLLLQLHDACQSLGDFVSGNAALKRIVPGSNEEAYELACTAAVDLDHLSGFSFFRTSDTAKAGHSYEIYQEKLREQVRSQIGIALEKAETAQQKERANALMRAIFQTHEGRSLKDVLAVKEETVAPPKTTETGEVGGTVRYEDGKPAAGVTVTLGLKFTHSLADPSSQLVSDMGGAYDMGPLYALTTITDLEGRYHFASVPADIHEFLAVTLDPAVYDVPTRFLKHAVEVRAQTVEQADLTITEWESSPPRQVISPFLEKFEQSGKIYRRVHELTLKNPFYFDFPRQIISFPLPSDVGGNVASLLLLSSVDPEKPHPFQSVNEGVAFFADLPRQSDRIFALYQGEGPTVASQAGDDLTMKPDPDGKTAVIDTGAASFRIAYGEGSDAVPPLAGVRGRDGLWRGQGRFQLPKEISILSRKTRILESGPLLLSIRIDYLLSNQAAYSWIVTAHRDEAYLLVKEISPEIEGAAFEFSLREFSGGRGYLHWKPEGGDQHWSDLKDEDRELARLQESVAWWLSPQGFGYGVTPKELDQQDFIAAFTRRRGDWIDRKFALISQGPGENRELDWPFPEMVGSTISMITAHTDTSGDVYFHFGFFDGERQWGVLVSDFDKNDGPFKELSAVQHKNSSPRLQDYKDWHLDEQDKTVRPFVVAHRKDLRRLRDKKRLPAFAKYWDRIATGTAHSGPVAGVLFAVDNNPLMAWQKKLELVYAAKIRSKMILLGRDFGDSYSPVGARPVAPWAESYDLIVASGCFTPDEERLVRQFFILMGHMHMEPDFMNWKFNSRNANFEADRTDLIGTIGICFLGHTDSKKFIDHCIGLMEKSLNVYCTPGSGKWYENPACYYLHASKCRMNLVFHLFRHDLFDATTIPRLKDFLRWGVLLLMPPCPSSYAVMRDGVPGGDYLKVDRVRRIPPIGDHAHIGPWVPDHYATAATMYRKTDPEFSDLLLAAHEEGGANGGYSGNAPLIFCALEEDDLRPAKLPQLPSRRLEGFGAVFRDHFGGDEEFYLLLKQGPAGYRYHRTEGSIILFIDSRPLIYDGGEAGDTWRHSTLSFYEADMPLATGHVERFHALPGMGFSQGVHPLAIKPGDTIYLNDNCHHTAVPLAYARFAEPNPVDVRSLFTVRDEYVVMHDDLRLDPAIRSRWHLQVVANGHAGDATTGYVFQGRFGIDLQVLFPGQVFVEEKVEHLPIHDYEAAPIPPREGGGFLFRQHHPSQVCPPEKSFATRHLMVQADSAKHYLALLRPLAPDRPPLEAQALRQDNRAVGLVVKGGKVNDVLFFNRETFVSQTDGIRFEGRYGGVVRRAGKLQLFLLAGRLLEAEGFRIVTTPSGLPGGEPAVALEVKPESVEMTAEGSGRVEIHGLATPAIFELTGNRITVSLDRG